MHPFDIHIGTVVASSRKLSRATSMTPRASRPGKYTPHMHAPHAHRALDTVRFVGRTYRTLHDMRTKRISPATAGGSLASDAAAMGPLYVKMAQFVSARRDAIDPDFAEALAVVQDQLPDLSSDGTVPAAPVVGGYTFEPTPIARASIADVFRGVRDSDGARVVLKRRRPGVADLIERDVPLLKGVLTAAGVAGLPGARNMAELVGESEGMLRAELDFRAEAANQREFSEIFSDLPWVVVPRVLWATEDALVSEYVPSRRLADVVAPNPALARRLMDLCMTMVARGLVHADPHPGNMGVGPGGRVVLYDFGAVVRVPPEVKPRVAKLLQAGLTRDVEGVMGALEGMGVIAVRPNQRTAVRRVVRRMLDATGSAGGAAAGGVHGELAKSR